MNKSNYLLLICLFLFSCSTNPWKGKKLYVLNCKLSGYTASLQELELNFISDKYLEAKETLNSSFGQVLTYKSNPAIGESKKIFSYTYGQESGVLEIEELKLNLNFTKGEAGELKSNLDEVLYDTSIVEILDSEEAKERVRKASPLPNLANMYIDMLQPQGKRIEVIEDNDGVAHFTEKSNNDLANDIKNLP